MILRTGVDGVADCTGCVASMAKAIDLVLAEAAGTRLTERGPPGPTTA